MRLATGIGVLLLVVASSAGSIGAQTAALAPVDGAALYSSIAPSVFLIEARDSSGKVLDFGSAFLVAERRLVTNAHVVNRGRFFLKTRTGAAPLSIERIDPHNDLALLRSDMAIDAPVLELATSAPPPGTSIWAFGSPKGLERTISDGIISGMRDRAGRRLLQITAAISQGSSGGPVVGRDGRVVGVTVGFLPGAQSVNFAVPIEFVVRLVGSSMTVMSAPSASTDEQQDGGDLGGNASDFPSIRTRGSAASCDAGQESSAALELDLALGALRSSLRGYLRADPIDTTRVASAHKGIAAILNRRGLYDQAEYHARQARTLAPRNPWPLHELSRALLCQAKAAEAAVVAEEAIRLTDGKSSAFHFDAGSAYFELKGWEQCSSAFEKASHLDQKDDAAPYHAAVCHARQGRPLDAARWMETALRRNPERSDRSDIEEQIRRWRQ
jgi:hypothetical protein